MKFLRMTICICIGHKWLHAWGCAFCTRCGWWI